jgi:hypothetical protein
MRLAQIDRRLRAIQAELVSAMEPAPAAPDPPSPHDPPSPQSPPPPQPPPVQERLARQVEQLTQLHVDLLSSISAALSGLQQALEAVPRLNPTEITLSAGPFATIRAVRAFERELAKLPDVRDVSVRGYEGEDRAVIDVTVYERTTYPWRR